MGIDARLQGNLSEILCREAIPDRSFKLRGPRKDALSLGFGERNGKFWVVTHAPASWPSDCIETYGRAKVEVTLIGGRHCAGV
jgi:hypothetical protein